MASYNESTTELHISENNKKLLKYVVEAILDAMPYSDDKGFASVSHYGVVGDYIEYQKGLILLKKLEIINGFQNTRYGEPVKNQTVYAKDAFAITFDEERLLDFSRELSDSKANFVPVPTNTPPSCVKVEPKSYDFANGILTVNGKQVSVIKQLNKKGKQQESRQARLMRLLFDDVKGDFGSTPMRTIVSVRAADFSPKHRKLVNSYASEINKKIHQEASVKDFLLTNQVAVMINEIYLN
jgi:hypothetical protein